MTDFTGSAGDDDFTGSVNADFFDMTQGGDDIVRGYFGDDVFNFGATFDENDIVSGGDGNDALIIGGDYSHETVFTSRNFRDVENLFLIGANDYLLTFQDGALRHGQHLVVSTTLVGDGTILFNGAAETNGSFEFSSNAAHDIVYTGGGNDTISTGGDDDFINPGTGNDTVNGGDGADRIAFGTGGLTAKDRIDGGDTTHVNTVVLDGDYSGGIKLSTQTFIRINSLAVSSGNDYVIDLGKTTFDGQFDVDANALGPNNSIVFDGSHILGTGYFNMRGGAGDDRLTAGGGDDSLTGRDGADRLEGGTGGDAYSYLFVADSTGSHYDTVVGFDTVDDLFIISPAIGVAVQAVDQKVTHGKLSTAHFDDHLENAIDADALGASHAVLFQPDAGTLAGQTFLIIDGNNVAGYQAGDDLVIRLTGAHHLGALSVSDFFTV